MIYSRFIVVAISVFLLFSTLVVKFYKIQIIEHDQWTKLANAQHQTTIVEPFCRGVFYSNTSLQKGCIEQKQPFVVDILKYHLFIDPITIPNHLKDEIGSYIINTLNLETTIIDNFYKKSRSRKIASWISTNKKDEIEKWWLLYSKEKNVVKNGIYFVKDYKRSYPFGKMLGQVLHTVRYDRDEKTHQAIPTGGLELSFNDYLKGKEGKRSMLRSPNYELESDLVDVASNRIQPEDGNDVYLTINHCLQAIVEEELARGVKKVGAKSGISAMMDPFTGEILAIAHYPFFDLSNYSDYYNEQSLLEHTRNKAITDCFEPGSTIKPINMSIALKANEELISAGKLPIFSPEEMIPCNQYVPIVRSQPIRDGHMHKYLNMYQAIQRSSNVYPATIVQKIVDRLGSEWYRKQLVEIFGLGTKSGIEIEGENQGVVPKSGKTYINGVLQWSTLTPCSLAIGYNITMNAIQMLRAYSVLANGGYLVNPTILKQIVSKDGKNIIYKHNCNNKKIVISESIVNEVVKAMKYVTKTDGSALLADVPGFTEAGKTSTSEKIINGVYSKNDHFSSFIGFTPAKNARFVLFVGIDEPKKMYIPGFGYTYFGGKCAAPVFREIAKRSLQYLGVAKDDPYGYQKGDPRCNIEKADWSKEVKHLSEIYKKWNK